GRPSPPTFPHPPPAGPTPPHPGAGPRQPPHPPLRRLHRPAGSRARPVAEGSARRGFAAPGKTRARVSTRANGGEPHAPRAATGVPGGIGSAQGAAKPRPSTGRAPPVILASRLPLQTGAERGETDRARAGDDPAAL